MLRFVHFLSVYTKVFFGSLVLFLLMLAPLLSQAQHITKLDLLNAAVHDTTFLLKSPTLSYPVVFVHQQDTYYQQSADAAVVMLPAALSAADFTQVELSTFKWSAEKQKAKLSMRWNDTIVKLRLRQRANTEQVSSIRAMKVRGKNRFWPTYYYYNNEVEL